MKKLLLSTFIVALLIGLIGCAGPSEKGASSASSKGSEDVSSAESTSLSSEASEAVAVSTEGEGKVKLGICLPARDQYLTTFERGCVAAAEAAGFYAQVVEAKDDISAQIAQIETFKNNDFDAVIVGLCSSESYNEAVAAAGDMKVIFFNRTVNPECLDGKQTVYVGMAEYDAGYAQGTWLSDYFKDSGKKDLKGILFMGILGQPSVTDRTQGVKDALKDNGYNVEWIFEDTADWDRAKSMDKFSQFVNTGAEFDMVVSNNDEMALGVIEACTASSIPIDFPIVGIDATEVGCYAIKDGTLKMTVNQNPTAQAAICVECINDLLKGKTPDGCDESFQFFTEAQAITPENVDEVLSTF